MESGFCWRRFEDEVDAEETADESLLAVGCLEGELVAAVFLAVLFFCDDEGDQDEAEEADDEEVECMAVASAPLPFFFESAVAA